MHVDPARSRAARHGRPGRRHPRAHGRRCRTRRPTAGCARIPGVGVWTSAEVRQRAHGDPDAVSFGDYHVAKDVGWALTGTPFDDDELEEFLEPWRPHRGRVPALVGDGRPAPAPPRRRGWRRAPTCRRASPAGALA